MKRIIYKTDEGGVAVIVPSAEYLLNQTIEELAVKDVPAGKTYHIVDASSIPSDRKYRSAWELVNKNNQAIHDQQTSIHTDSRRDSITGGITMTSQLKVDRISPATGSEIIIDGFGGGGKVLQVISTTKTDIWSSSLTVGAEADVTGLNVSITPSSTSSKILIMASVNGHNGSEGGLGFLITESGTMIEPPDSAGNKGNGKVHSSDVGLNHAEINTQANFQILHSPSSTSALTYQAVRMYGVSTITAMEIGS